MRRTWEKKIKAGNKYIVNVNADFDTYKYTLNVHEIGQASNVVDNVALMPSDDPQSLAGNALLSGIALRIRNAATSAKNNGSSVNASLEHVFEAFKKQRWALVDNANIEKREKAAKVLSFIDKLESLESNHPLREAAITNGLIEARRDESDDFDDSDQY